MMVKKLWPVIIVLPIILSLGICGCKTQPVTTTVSTTVTVPTQTITSTNTITAAPQTITVTKTETITETNLVTPVTTSPASISATSEVKSTLSGVETEVQYAGMAKWDFVIDNIIVTASSTDVFVKLDIKSMYQKSAYIEAQFYDANDNMLGVSSVVEVRIAQAGSVKTVEIKFSLDAPSRVTKCILVISEEE